MSFPKISVIIPNYNHARYLTRRIDSVLAQTYSNIEVIILDDCSTDTSKEVIEKFRSHDKVKQILYNNFNTGSPFLQWKKGLESATGEWIWIAESDDYAAPQFLETMLSSIKEEKHLGLLYCDSAIVINDVVQEETFASQRNKKLNTTRWAAGYINNGRMEIEDYLLAHGSINNTSAVLFNREVLLKTSPFDIPFRFMGDKYAFIKVLSVSDILYVYHALNYYRAAVDAKPKHTQDFLDYSYEQFLIFNWVDRNIKNIDKRKFDEAFKLNTEVSLISISAKKIGILLKMLKLNTWLFLKLLKNNLLRTLNRG